MEILSKDYINQLARIELRGRIVDGTVDFDCDDDGKYATYDYDIREIVDAVVEDLAQAVDYESSQYEVIVDIIEQFVNDAIDEEMLDELASNEACEAQMEAHERYLQKADMWSLA